MMSHLDCEGRGCSALAEVHLRGPAAQRLACFDHFAEIVEHPAALMVSRHYLCPDCGMPGAVWDSTSNTCNVPDVVCEGLAEGLQRVDSSLKPARRSP